MCSFNLFLFIFILVTIHSIISHSSTVDIASEVQPCFFNQLCTCSRSFGDLGHVQCHEIEMNVVPFLINQSHVYKLSFRRNNLRTIEDNSFASTGLFGLEISDNLLSKLKVNTFAGVENSLRELNLQSNLLTYIPVEALRSLERLQTLNLNHNLINRLPSGRKFPEKLSLTLKNLLLADNCLIFIDQYAFPNFKSLEHIDLSENSIHFIHELAFAPFNNRPYQYESTPLAYLNLAQNRLKVIPFKLIHNLPVLQILNLNDNQIKSTYDSAFSTQTLHLNELHLEFNEIEQLEERSFRNFRKINKTFLSFNSIHTLPRNVFKDVEINQIYLIGCKLVNISSHAWVGLEESLKYLDLSLNNFHPSFKTGFLLNNDSFSALESLKGFTLNDNSEYYRLNPFSFALSQHTLQEFSARVDPRLYRRPFSPTKYELQFNYVRKLSLTNLHYENHLTKIDLLGYGGYNLEYLDLSSANIEEISLDAFTETPSIKLLNLSYNYITRLNPRVLKPVSRSLQVLDLRSGLWTKHLECNMFMTLGSLLSLSLMDNGLETLSSRNCFSRLKHLKTLVLSFNSFSHLDPFLFSSLSNLVHLLLAYNKLIAIESYSFSQLHQLATLDLSYNAITIIKSFAFNGLNVLSELNLEGNDIEYIEREAFTNLPRIKRINLSYNRLKVVEIEAFDQVGTMSTLELQLSHNLIGEETEIILKSSSEVANSFEIIDLSNNNITQLNTSCFETFSSTLTHLILENNNLKMITSTCVAKLKRLQKLSLKNNQIESLAYDSFKHEFLLQILDLSFNSLSDLSDQLFEDNAKLRIVYLGTNQLRSIPEQLFAKTLDLEMLDLSNNRLSVFPAKALSQAGKSLQTLNLAGNRIKALKKDDFEGLFKNLLNLDLNGNLIKQIKSNTFEELSQLLTLDLSNNPLHTIKESVVTGLDNLESLNLANIHLEEMPNFNLKIKHLNVSNNQLHHLPIYLRNLSMLECLDISSNRFSLLPNNIWHILPNLRRLDISHNQVNVLANDSFIGLQKLEELKIKNLTLSHIQYGVLKPLQALQMLHLSTYPNLEQFEIGRLLAENNAIVELVIDVNQTSIGPNQMSLNYFKFPKKLKKLALTGSKLSVLEPGILDNVQSDTLELTVENSNVTYIHSEVFQFVGQVRNLVINVKDNALQTMEDFFESPPLLSKVITCLPFEAKKMFI